MIRPRRWMSFLTLTVPDEDEDVTLVLPILDVMEATSDPGKLSEGEESSSEGVSPSGGSSIRNSPLSGDRCLGNGKAARLVQE